MAEAGEAEINGTRLYYEVRGAGPAVLLVPGFTLDRRMWAAQFDALAAHHRVVAYDPRGAGRSALPGETPYRHCEDAAALCEHLGLGPVVAVGHSLGGLHAIELALSRPDLVAGLVTVCTSALSSVPFTDDLTALFTAVRTAARADGVAAAKALWVRAGWFGPARETPTLAAALDRIVADYSGWHWTHDNPSRNIEPPAAERLGELRMPATVVTGGRDLAYNHAITRALAVGLPGARQVLLARAGHMAPMEDPEAVTDAILELGARVAVR